MASHVINKTRCGKSEEGLSVLRVTVEEFRPQAAPQRRAEILMEEVDAADCDAGNGRCVAILARRFDPDHGHVEACGLIRGALAAVDALVGAALGAVADGELEEASECLRDCMTAAWGMSDA